MTGSSPGSRALAAIHVHTHGRARVCERERGLYNGLSSLVIKWLVDLRFIARVNAFVPVVRDIRAVIFCRDALRMLKRDLIGGTFGTITNVFILIYTSNTEVTKFCEIL